MFWLHLSILPCGLSAICCDYVDIFKKFILTENEKTFLGEHLLTGGLLRVVTCSAAT